MEDSLKLLEASRIAGCHPSTLRRKIQRGEIPAFRLFGRIRIGREDLQSYLARSSRKPNTDEDRCGRE